jgi:hypothetical protein
MLSACVLVQSMLCMSELVVMAPCVQVSHLLHMAMWGFQWRLLPGHFVIHVPHPSSKPPPGGWEVSTTPLVVLKARLCLSVCSVGLRCRPMHNRQLNIIGSNASLPELRLQ